MSKRTLGTVAVTIGLLCILGAVGLTLRNINTDNRAAEKTAGILEQLTVEESSGNVTRPVQETEAAVPVYPFPSHSRRPEFLEPEHKPEMATVLVDGREYIGVITIPRMKSELPVQAICDDVSINVSPGRFHGSPETGAFVIGGHNYVSHFGRLDWLREGDEVLFTDVEGKKTLYTVSGSELLSASAVEDLISDEWDLSLFTCTFSGSQRLTVRCIAADSSTDR